MIGPILPFLLFYRKLIKSPGFNYHLYLYNFQSIFLILTVILNSSITFLIAYRTFPCGSQSITANSTESIITSRLSILYLLLYLLKENKGCIQICLPFIVGWQSPLQHSKVSANCFLAASWSWVSSHVYTEIWNLGKAKVQVHKRYNYRINFFLFVGWWLIPKWSSAIFNQSG